MKSVWTATKGFECGTDKAHLPSRISSLDLHGLYILSKGSLTPQHNPVESGKLGSKFLPLSGLKLNLPESSKHKLMLFQIPAAGVS